MMEDKNLAQISLPVQGMTCAACVSKVERSLRSISGVDEVNVNLLSSKVALSYDKDKTSAPQIVNNRDSSGRRDSLSFHRVSRESGTGLLLHGSQFYFRDDEYTSAETISSLLQ